MSKNKDSQSRGRNGQDGQEKGTQGQRSGEKRDGACGQ